LKKNAMYFVFWILGVQPGGRRREIEIANTRVSLMHQQQQQPANGLVREYKGENFPGRNFCH
jgi:hypothetical protein